MQITFDEIGHTYTDQYGTIIPSVTQILGQVYGTGLEDAPSYFVERAAEKGTKIHKEIEAYLKEGKEGNTPEFNVWKGWFSGGKCECEKIIFATTPYGPFTGTVDFIDTFLRDWKTCKTATRKQIDKWQKQLSFYYYALKQMGYSLNLPLKIMHLTDKLEVINVDYLGDLFVEDTMKLYQEGEHPEAVSTDLQTVTPNEIEALEQMMVEVEKAEKLMASIREKVKKEMEKRGILNLKVGKVSMTYVPLTVKSTFDGKTFKQDNPDLYKKYLKDSEVKPYLRVTIKEDK